MTKTVKKEHGIVYPSNYVHISTIPLKLAPKIKKTEADSATTNVAQLRDKKEKKTKESKIVNLRSGAQVFQIKESNNSPFKNHSFQVILIQEGLGNFKDRFFYTKEALKSAAQSRLFEGVQCFADHPTEIEEQIQPERSTRDILGYYENVQFEENDEGMGQLVATLNVSNSVSLDWAMSLLTNSINYSTKFRESDLVGLSINASGSASPIGLDEFMASNQLAPSILQKLNEAKAQGVTEIQIVSELKDALSVDLVTKAGAGGKILRMLEQENLSMKRKRFFESESEAEKHHEDGAADASAMAPKKDGATPDHADEDQDKALFAKMIKQYLGKDDADESEMEIAKHAYQAHKEKGMAHEEAYEAAGQHLKMAAEIGKKMAQCKQSESESESEAHESESESEAESHESEGELPAPMKKKESMVIKLSGEVAKLKESLKRYELKDYLDDKMKASGKSNIITKAFREALGQPKSKEHIDSTWKLFLKAYEFGAEEVGSHESFITEKTYHRESASASRSSFADCIR